MKRAGVVGIVVAAHCVVIGSVVLIQGCGTTPKTVEPQTSQVVMPPSMPPAPPPVVVPAEKLPPVVLPVVVPPVAPVSKTYTVKAGDSLSSIAKHLNVTTRDLVKLNSIANANKIHVGQKLSVPGYVDLNAPAPAHAKKAAAPGKKAAKGAPVKAGEGEYVVKAGDSLAKIAHKNGTTIAALKQANNLTSDKLKVGQKLVLSGKAPAGETPVAPADKGPAVEQPVTPVEGGTPPPVVEPKANEVVHVVEPNQDLSSIAMMYGVRVEDMLRLNNLASPDVKVGQTLKIPPPVE